MNAVRFALDTLVLGTIFLGTTAAVGGPAAPLADPPPAAPWMPNDLPNDPYFPVKAVFGPTLTPSTYQWGLHAMQFPAAWAKTRGHGYVGLIEGDRPAAHEDLRGHYRYQFDNCAGSSFCDTNPGGGVVPHATHVAGIVAAQTNNEKGVAGACPECSIAAYMPSFAPSVSIDADFAAAIHKALDSGMQVLNWSGSLDTHSRWGTFKDCSTVPALCIAMERAKKRDVLLVQSAGNFSQPRPAFPSFQYQDYWVLPVGGTAIANPRVGDPGARWTYPLDPTFGSALVGTEGVVAPAKSIVSTFKPGDYIGSDEPDANCGDTPGIASGLYSHLLGRDESGVFGDGYGSCTGTSMAAPHVSALAGIVRSVNPLLSADQVRQIIRNSGNQASAVVKSQELGWGLPNASKAVDAALATLPTRLTPLFSFYSADRADSFYTTVPQMARAALGGTLAPRAGAAGIQAYNSAYGNLVSGYPEFPDPVPAQPVFGGSPTVDHLPRAEVYVFTTPSNPKSSTVPLTPLYRLSWKCGDTTTGAQPALCGGNPSHMDVTYTADPAGVTVFEGLGYKLDGIEGYLYPKTLPQPVGTVRLMRKYNPQRDDHAIFPETQLPAMSSAGYTQDSGSDWLGYVYPNTGVAIVAIP